MSVQPRVRCSHCRKLIYTRDLATHRKYRNKYGVDIFTCPECFRNIKIDPQQFLTVLQQPETPNVSEKTVISAVSEHDLLPCEQMAIEEEERGGLGNRHVPIIMGILALVGAVFFLLYFSGWWKTIPVALLLVFSWSSIWAGFFASSKEIAELTGDTKMPEESAKEAELLDGYSRWQRYRLAKKTLRYKAYIGLEILFGISATLAIMAAIFGVNSRMVWILSIVAVVLSALHHTKQLFHRPQIFITCLIWAALFYFLYDVWMAPVLGLPQAGPLLLILSGICYLLRGESRVNAEAALEISRMRSSS